MVLQVPEWQEHFDESRYAVEFGLLQRAWFGQTIGSNYQAERRRHINQKIKYKPT